VSIKLTTPTANSEFNYRVVDLPALTPILTAYGLSEIVYASEGSYEDMTLVSRTSLAFNDTCTITIKHIHTGLDPAAMLFRRTLDELQFLLGSPFGTPTLDSVRVELEFVPGKQAVYITGARPSRWTVAPGESLDLAVTLRREDGNEEKKSVLIGVPLTTPEGPLTVSVSSRDSLFYRETMRAPGATQPQSFEHLCRVLERTGGENILAVAGFSTRPGITIKGKELPDPPPSLRRVLQGGIGTESIATTAESVVFSRMIPLDDVIAGVVEIQLEVRR